MKNIIFYCTILFLSASFANAQQWLWAKDMGSGIGFSIKTDAQGNIYELAGTGNMYANVTSTCGTGNVIAKHDSTGNLIWARFFNFGVSSFDLDRVGNVYVTGSFHLWSAYTPSTVCGGNNPDIGVSSCGGGDLFLCKYDNNGNLLWVKTWGHPNSDDSPTAMRTDALAGRSAAGHGFNNPQDQTYGPVDHFLLKYDTQGNLIWSNSTNFNGNMVTFGLDVDNAGNTYISGYFYQTAVFDAITITSNTGSSAYIAKFNSNGQAIWAKKDGTSNDQCFGLCLDKKGGLYIIGTSGGQSVFSGTNTTQSGMFVVKYDTSGNGLWVKKIINTWGRSVRVDSAANCFVVGVFKPSVTFNTTPSTTLNTAKQFEVFVAKYDKNGNIKWAVAPNGTSASNDDIQGVYLDDKNNCFITGSYTGTSIFGNTTLAGGGIYIAKLKNSSPLIITNMNPHINSSYGELNIYPNPVRNQVSISYSCQEEIKGIHLTIRTVAGVLVHSAYFPVNGNRFSASLNLEEYSKGLYFIETEPVSATEQQAQAKLLKKIVLE